MTKKNLFKVARISGIVLAGLVAAILLLPELFPGFVAGKIKKWAHQHLEGKLEFSGARLSFIRHFPSLTLSLNNFSLTGAAPFANDKLLSGKELAFGIDLSSIFKPKLKVDKFFLDQAFINVQVDSSGHANYNIYKATGSDTSTQTADSSGAALKIEKIEIAHSRLVYNDQSLPMQIIGDGFNYTGTGDLSNEEFDLASELNIDSLDFLYDGEAYVEKKKLGGKLITKINTSSLALVFEKNDLLINQLPVNFKGRFDFLKNGYEIDLRFNSGHTNLHDIFTVLPPQYLHWLADTEMNGDAVLKASFIGQYIAETHTSPTLEFGMQVYGGSVNHAKAPVPVTNLLCRFNLVVPGLNADSLTVNLDTLSFNLGRDYLHAAFHSQGINPLRLQAHADAELDLEKLDQAIGFDGFDLKGKSRLHFVANGLYTTGINPNKLRPDTIITSIPVFELETAVENGFLKYHRLPEALRNLSFSLRANCPTNNYRHTSLALDNVNARFLQNYIKGFFHLKDMQAFSIKAGMEMALALADIEKVVPLNGLQIKGGLQGDIKLEGDYDPAKKRFPTTAVGIQLKDGWIKTPYYPNAIENINLDLKATDSKTTLAGLVVAIQPLSFSFEQQPFSIEASLANFTNLSYHVRSKGVLDIGRIYQVFSQKGWGVKGQIETNLTLRGTQADAAAGRYHALQNAGSLRMKDIVVAYDAYPKPFHIQQGLLQFKQDKVRLNNFSIRYGDNQLAVSGHLSNTIDYILQDKPLKGLLDLQTGRIAVDDFMAFADDADTAVQNPAAGESGVVIVPKNLSIEVNAAAKHVTYSGMDIDDVKGKLLLDSGRIKLQETAFRLADAMIKIDAGYSSLSAKKGEFNFAIEADSFDIKKAYKEVKLFRDMASSASKAEGIVSLQYNLKGKLDGNMSPIYPSLKGGGVLTLAKIKVYGLPLFAAVSKASGRDSINNPDLKNVAIKTTIANNIITIERTKMKVFGFRPRIEGQASFDGRLNLAFRLGLPPFGIFGIPMTVTGTSAKPIVKLKRAKEGDRLEEDVEEGENE